MWGTDGVRVVHRSDDGWGWIFNQFRRALERPSVSADHVCKRGDRFAAQCSRSPWCACRAVWLDRGRRGIGTDCWPCGWITAPQTVSVGPLHQLADQASGASSRPHAFVAEPQTNGVAERFNRTLKEQIGSHGRIYLQLIAPSSCGTAVKRLRRYSTMPRLASRRRMNGYLSPRRKLVRRGTHAIFAIRPAA